MVEMYRSGIMVAATEIPAVLRELLKDLLTYCRLETTSIRGKISRAAIPVRMWSERPDGSMLFYAGYVPRVTGFLKQHGIAVTKYERVDRKTELTYTLANVKVDTLRPEQIEFMKGFVSWEGGLLVGPTGSGKSFLCAEFCKMYPAASFVFAAPTIDTVATLRRYLVEHAGEEVGQVGGGRNFTRRVTVATYDSITKVSGVEKIDILIVDEVHRAASEGYAKNLASIGGPLKRFGFTATEDGRSDKAEWLTEGLFGPIVVNIPYSASVASGSVVPLEIVVHVNPFGPSPADIDAARSQADKDRMAIWTNRGRNQLIARDVGQMMEVLGNPQTLILVDRIEHLLSLAKFLDGFEIAYGNLDMARLKELNLNLDMNMTKDDILGIKDREATRKRFESGEAKKVLATSIFATGVSSNYCGLVAVASGAGAPIAFLQSIGRSSRTNAADGKVRGVCLFWEDDFHKGYRARARKLINTAHTKGHRIHRITADQEVRLWTPPN